MELPVIGEQHFGLSITSDREAQLTLQGAVNLDGRSIITSALTANLSSR